MEHGSDHTVPARPATHEAIIGRSDMVPRHDDESSAALASSLGNVVDTKDVKDEKDVTITVKDEADVEATDKDNDVGDKEATEGEEIRFSVSE